MKYVFFLLALLASCKTIIYSPSVNLPDKMEKGETKVFAAYEDLMDSRNNTQFQNNSILLGIQHSFWDNYCLGFKYWSDMNTYSKDMYYLHGASLTNYILLNDKKADFKYYVIPTIGIAMKNSIIDLGVVGTWIGIQWPQLSVFKPYLTAGFMYGNYDSHYNLYGFGIPANIGSNIHIYKNFSAMLELTVTSLFDKHFYWQKTAITPTIGFNFGF